MLKPNQTLGRTIHYSNFSFYSTDGFGRDSYINYDNGGILKDNLRPLFIKSKYPKQRNNVYRSLSRIPPSVKYHSDGSGRDTYVIDRDGGLVQQFSPFNPIPLQHYLRSYKKSPKAKPNYTPVYSSEANALLNKIQRNVIDRLYTTQRKKFAISNSKSKSIYMNHLNSHYCPLIRESHSTKSMNVNRIAIDCCNDDSLNKKGVKFPHLSVSPSNDNKLIHSIKKNFRITFPTLCMNNSKIFNGSK